VRTAEKQRVEKLLEDAQIKLSVVAADIFGVSGRAMLEALVAGERDRLAALGATPLEVEVAVVDRIEDGRDAAGKLRIIGTRP
jgi:transposase